MTHLLKVQITSPDSVIWEGNALSVSSVNSQGPFDVLPMHANFISIIQNQPIKIISEIGKKEFTFERCVMYVHSNVVKIYSHL